MRLLVWKPGLDGGTELAQVSHQLFSKSCKMTPVAMATKR